MTTFDRFTKNNPSEKEKSFCKATCRKGKSATEVIIKGILPM